MHIKKQKNHVVDLLFTIALFCVFAVSALSVILLGANVYRSVTKTTSATYETRTVLSYIAQKFQSYDNGYPPSVMQIDGTEVLTLQEMYNGELYTTYIYTDGQALKELFARSDSTFSPDAGTVILEGASLSMEELEDGIFCLTVSGKDQKTSRIYLHPKSEGRHV